MISGLVNNEGKANRDIVFFSPETTDSAVAHSRPVSGAVTLPGRRVRKAEKKTQRTHVELVQTVEGEMNKKVAAKINTRSGATIAAVAGGSVCAQGEMGGGRGYDVISAKVRMWKKDEMQGCCLEM